MSSFLFLNQYFWPDEAPTAQLLADLSVDLVKAGHQVTVVCGSARYSCDEKLSSGVFDFQGVRIERVGGTDWGRYRWIGRLMDLFTFIWNLRRWLRNLPRHDAVIVMTSPPLIGDFGLWFSRRHRVPLVLWAQDVYPEIAERLGVLKNCFLYAWTDWKTKRIYSKCQKIVVVGEDMKEFLETRKEAAGKLLTIPNWADVDRIFYSKVKENPIRKEMGWNQSRVLMYAGNMGAVHDLDAMLLLVSLLEAEIPSFKFVLVGSSPRHQAFAEKARENGVKSLVCLPFQKRECLGEVLGAADAHLISQKEVVDGLVVPSKFYTIVAAGRPVIWIGSCTSQIGRHVIESRLGAVVSPGKVSAGISGAKKALFMAQDEAWAVPFIRDWAVQHASRSVRTSQFRQALEEVLKC